jgi:fructoselysine-6-P-deglycase FrlB-like protein
MDPLGHDLLAQRLASIPQLLGSMLDAPPLALSSRGERIVVTGTGSSEAHARYLVTLLNRRGGPPAEFLPLSGFCDAPSEFFAGKVLVVVSQGVSPNAQVALSRRHDFAGCIVLTASTAAGALAANKPERARLIEALESSGTQFVRFPLEEEYSTLIRFVGPMAGYLAAFSLAASAGAQLPRIDRSTLAPLLARTAEPDLVAYFVEAAEEMRRGFYLVCAAPLVEYAHNLGYKFLEGLFWSSPGLWDFLQFAHGPFQELTLQPRPVIILEGPEPATRELAGRTRSMLDGVGLPCRTIAYSAPDPLAIFELEAVFNSLVFQLIQRFAVDQIRWPSKGKDDPLYGFYRL